MLWNIASSSLAVGLTAVVVISFVFGSVLNAVLGENGFGSPGNAVIFVLGFSSAVYFANSHGVSLYDLHLVAAWGIGGAFALFSVAVLLKAGLAKH